MFESIVELADTVRIFPLPGALLLPRAQLPLHVFEPRYRNMTSDALAGDRLIAMIQPSGEDGGTPENPAIYGTGCLGRIEASDELEDGRLNIVLTGVARFDVIEELPLYRGYRRVLADFRSYEADLVEDGTASVDRAKLLDRLDRFLKAKELKADWDAIRTTRDEPLVSSLAMICPFAPREKQALLESPDLARRCDVLITLLEFGAFAEAAGSESTPVPH